MNVTDKEFNDLDTLEKAQAVTIGLTGILFQRAARIWFGIKHPILDWNWCFSKQECLPLDAIPGVTVKVVSRIKPENMNGMYFYVIIEHEDHPDKFLSTKIFHPATLEESKGLEGEVRRFFNGSNPLALSGYKPNKYRELTRR